MGAFLSAAFGLAVWALTIGSETSSRAVARSIRAVVGPPRPEPAHAIEPGGLEDVDLDELVDAGGPDLGAFVGPPLVVPEKPRALRGVSFVLLLGMDNRTDRVTGRTDTMVIAAFRHRDGKVAAFSIPRDLWVEIPELGPARMSSVVRVGNFRIGAGVGIPLLRRMIQEELGITIDRYAAVDLAGFVALVDQMHGVDVDVQCPIIDCLWMSPDDEACEELNVEAGRQHMDGRTALKFVRSRHGRGDRDRRRRQQAVLLAFGRAVREQGLGGVRGLWETARPHVETDLEWDSAAYYASFALETDLHEVRGFSITGELVERHVTEKRQHVLVLDRDAFGEALANMFEKKLPGLRERKKCPPANAAEAARERGRSGAQHGPV
jgi:LCP family protein required for cell wall assembly